MPVARIITTSARYSDGLADDLRSRGFQVLTSAPGDSVSESADLEITLNECLPEDARAAATDSPVTKDMRVFVTPQAFAGNIRSIEMFVLTPQRVTVQKLEMEGPIEQPSNLTPASLGAVPLGKMLEFIAPAEVVSHDTSNSVDTGDVNTNNKDIAAVEVEVASSEVEEKEEAVLPAMEAAPEILPVLETIQSEPPSMIGRAVLASTQTAVPAWPDMSEMKLVPAELAPAVVKPVGMPLQDAVLSQKVPAGGSFRAQSVRDIRFWKVPIVVGIVAIFALSAVRLANHFSNSHAQAGTVQQVTPSSIQVAMPSAAAPVSTAKLAGTMQSSTAATLQKPAEKPVRISIKAKVRASRPAAKRGRSNSESGYVAKDTTVYFSKPPAVQTADQKALARP